MKPSDSATATDPSAEPRRDHNPDDCQSCTDWNPVRGECLVAEPERRRICGWRPPKRRRTRRPAWPLFADGLKGRR